MIWNRRLWMRLGVVNALCSLAAGLVAMRVDPSVATLLRLGAQFQFMHSLAIFACAAFMMIGASAARHAPVLFLAGSVMFSGTLYARAATLAVGGDITLAVGAALMAAGWGVLLVSSATIDSEH